MKYSIEVLKQQNIPYSWDTLYVGLEIGVIDHKDLMHYAIEYLEVVPDVEDTNILELAWGFEETNDKRVLIEILKECNLEEILQEGDKFEGEARKWRYGILESLKKSIEMMCRHYLKLLLKCMLIVDTRVRWKVLSTIFLQVINIVRKSILILKIPID